MSSPASASSDSLPSRGAAAWPWGTVLFASLAVAAHLIPAWREALFLLRAEVLDGEWWRLWTGHAVHFSGNHLLWNLAVFVPSTIWLERIDARGARVYLAAAPPVIALLLLVGDPALIRYGGLSGVATGTLVLLAALQLSRRDPREPVWFWLAVLGLVVAKLVVEQISQAPLLVSDLGEVRTVPLAHLGGAGCAALVWIWRRNRAHASRLMVAPHAD